MEVRWSPQAVDDLTAIILYIRKQNPSAAERVAQTLYDGVSALHDLPRRGRPGRVNNTRELVFAPLPFVVVYRLRKGVIEIARVLHGSQRWP